MTWLLRLGFSSAKTHGTAARIPGRPKLKARVIARKTPYNDCSSEGIPFIKWADWQLVCDQAHALARNSFVLPVRVPTFVMSVGARTQFSELSGRPILNSAGCAVRPATMQRVKYPYHPGLAFKPMGLKLTSWVGVFTVGGGFRVPTQSGRSGGFFVGFPVFL